MVCKLNVWKFLTSWADCQLVKHNSPLLIYLHS